MDDEKKTGPAGEQARLHAEITDAICDFDEAVYALAKADTVTDEIQQHRDDAYATLLTAIRIHTAAPSHDWARELAEKKAGIVVTQWMATPERHYADLIAAVAAIILEALQEVAAPQRDTVKEME